MVSKVGLPTDPIRSALMARVRQKGTKPELKVAQVLRFLGLAYRKTARDLPGSPDFVNRKRRWAVFVNGCYWHHHQCPRGTIPTRNREFWVAKFRTNRARDARAIRSLRMSGYRVFIVWECETQDPDRMARRLIKLRADRRASPSSQAPASPPELQDGHQPASTQDVLQPTR